MLICCTNLRPGNRKSLNKNGLLSKCVLFVKQFAESSLVGKGCNRYATMQPSGGGGRRRGRASQSGGARLRGEPATGALGNVGARSCRSLASDPYFHSRPLFLLPADIILHSQRGIEQVRMGDPRPLLFISSHPRDCRAPRFLGCPGFILMPGCCANSVPHLFPVLISSSGL